MDSPGPLALTMTGEKIRQVVDAALKILEDLDPLTEEDLDQFEAYLSRLEAGLPVTDPTAYRKVAPHLPAVQARVALVRAAVRYRDEYGSAAPDRSRFAGDFEVL